MAQANEADRKSADERLMSEHAAKVQPVMIVLFQLEPRKNMFKKACPIRVLRTLRFAEAIQVHAEGPLAFQGQAHPPTQALRTLRAVHAPRASGARGTRRPLRGAESEP